MAAVELEEDEEGEEKTGNPRYVCVHQEVSSGRREGVVEAIAVDVDGEYDAADDVQQVVDGQVLRDGIVDRGRSGGGGIESVEWVDQQLGGCQEGCWKFDHWLS